MLPRRNLKATGAVGERIYGRFSSVDQSGSFAGVFNLGKPLYREKTVYIIYIDLARAKSEVPIYSNEIEIFFI